MKNERRRSSCLDFCRSRLWCQWFQWQWIWGDCFWRGGGNKRRQRRQKWRSQYQRWWTWKCSWTCTRQLWGKEDVGEGEEGQLMPGLQGKSKNDFWKQSGHQSIKIHRFHSSQLHQESRFHCQMNQVQVTLWNFFWLMTCLTYWSHKQTCMRHNTREVIQICPGILKQITVFTSV